MLKPAARVSCRLLVAGVLCLVLRVLAADAVSVQLVVTGAVKTPLALDLDTLRAFPADRTASVSVMRRLDGDREATSTLRGVRLTAVLERAGFAGPGPNDWKRTVVLATATDGYQVVFSWSELFNSDLGGGALVVFERDGAPLTDREGRIALVSARDLRPGPRSVRRLARLEVRTLTD